MRIVSLLPSATEIVCGLGLERQLVGVTHECDEPAFVRALPKVTRTLIPIDATSREIDALVREKLTSQRALYSLDFEMLESLDPDLIVTQTLCDVCAVATEEVEAAACRLPRRPRIVELEPTNMAQVLESIRAVGSLAGVADFGKKYVRSLEDRIARVRQRTSPLPKLGVVLLEWIDPPFSCGHWSPELVEWAGGRELLSKAGERSRMLSWQEILDAQPDVMILACCGYSAERTQQDVPILEAQSGWRDLPCVQSGRVHLVDGSAYFSRPGPRLVDSLEILADLLHPR